MSLAAVASLVRAGRNPALLAMHTHDITWMVKNTVSCPRCQADQAVLEAARRLAESAPEETPTP